VNAARKDSKDFSRAFVIITPGITIRDRLRVLFPSEPDNAMGHARWSRRRCCPRCAAPRS
jgi:hypothetical protein